MQGQHTHTHTQISFNQIDFCSLKTLDSVLKFKLRVIIWKWTFKMLHFKPTFRPVTRIPYSSVRALRFRSSGTSKDTTRVVPGKENLKSRLKVLCCRILAIWIWNILPWLLLEFFLHFRENFSQREPRSSIASARQTSWLSRSGCNWTPAQRQKEI